MTTASSEILPDNAAEIELIRVRPSLTETEAAIYLNLSVSWLRKSREGTLPPSSGPFPPYRKLGRSVRYLRADLDEWLNSSPKQITRADGSLVPLEGGAANGRV